MADATETRFFLLSSNMPEANLGTDIEEAKRKARMARDSGLFEGLRLVRREVKIPTAPAYDYHPEQLPCFDAADHER